MGPVLLYIASAILILLSWPRRWLAGLLALGFACAGSATLYSEYLPPMAPPFSLIVGMGVFAGVVFLGLLGFIEFRRRALSSLREGALGPIRLALWAALSVGLIVFVGLAANGAIKGQSDFHRAILQQCAEQTQGARFESPFPEAGCRSLARRASEQPNETLLALSHPRVHMSIVFNLIFGCALSCALAAVLAVLPGRGSPRPARSIAE